MVLSTSVFAQNKERGIHIILQSIDTSYFDDEGIRWQEFSLTPRKYYRVMDLMESDTTCGCEVIKGNKSYMSYLKSSNWDRSMHKFNKSVIGYLECKFDSYNINMWIFENESFGFVVSNTLE